MSPTFDEILAEALARLDRGEELTTVLGSYPQHATRLAPLLDTAQRACQAYAWTEPPSEAALEAGRQRLLRQAVLQPCSERSEPGRRTSEPWYHRLWMAVPLPTVPMPGLASAAVAVLLVILVSAGAVTAAASSLPGDALYPVKRAAERVQLAVTFDPTARASLAERIAAKRRGEARRVAELGRRVEVAFDGHIEDIEEGGWMVDGLELVISPGTVIEGQPRTGARVQVVALPTGDGSLLAHRITIETTTMPSPMVTSTPVELPATSPTASPTKTATRMPQPTPTPSMPAHPKAVPTVMPYRTETPTMVPTMTPMTMMTPTMMPTMTPQPTMMPTMTPQPMMTPTMMPTMTPMTMMPTMTPHRPRLPTATSTATPHPTDTPMPQPTNTPQPTATPRPTDTQPPAPTATPQPTMTPMTTMGPMGTMTPPMMTPHPTRTRHH